MSLVYSHFFYQKYRFFWTLPVFSKNTGDSDCISQNYAQRTIREPSFRAIANFRKKYRFFGTVSIFSKKYRKFWVDFWKVRSKIYTYAKFQSHRKVPSKYRFSGILPVFWKNSGNSDMIIGQFFSFSPKPVRPYV